MIQFFFFSLHPTPHHIDVAAERQQSKCTRSLFHRRKHIHTYEYAAYLHVFVWVWLVWVCAFHRYPFYVWMSSRWSRTKKEKWNVRKNEYKETHSRKKKSSLSSISSTQIEKCTVFCVVNISSQATSCIYLHMQVCVRTCFFVWVLVCIGNQHDTTLVCASTDCMERSTRTHTSTQTRTQTHTHSHPVQTVRHERGNGHGCTVGLCLFMLCLCSGVRVCVSLHPNQRLRGPF